MADSKLDICNAALLQLGEDEIADFETEQSATARLCRNHYDRLRRSVLSEGQWGFAMNRQLLARLTDAPTFGFDYAYGLPTDMIQLVRVEEAADYRVEKTTIVTDAEKCEVLYVQNIEDTSRFHPMFTEALVARLAAEIGYAVTRDIQNRTLNYQIYQEKLDRALSVNSYQDTEYPFGRFDYSLLNVRS